MPNLIHRYLTKHITSTLKSMPLVYLNGARQVGKSTLCSQIKWESGETRFSFDEPFTVADALERPADFMQKLSPTALNIIDEVQFAPPIFPYLKMRIDERRLAGQGNGLFLLTGSANLLALPQLADALVGRMAIWTLYPLAAAEYGQITPIDFFAEDLLDRLAEKSLASDDLISVIQHSTYPSLAFDENIIPRQWFDWYLRTILDRDVQALSDLKNPLQMATFLAVLAMRTGGLVNLTAMAQEVGVHVKTAEKMLLLALNAFLIYLLKPWAPLHRLNKRFVKSPKLYFLDTNFLAYLLKQDVATIYTQGQAFWGHILENFVATELVKLASWEGLELSYYRTQQGQEVDFVLEKGNKLIGVEVKSSATLSHKFLKGLEELKEVSGKRFKRGILLYTGQKVVAMGSDCWAVPLSALWR